MVTRGLDRQVRYITSGPSPLPFTPLSFIFFISKMATVCALFHSALAPNTPCPFCHHSNGPYKGVTNTPETPNQAQYTPVAPGTVTALRQTIGTGNAYRAAKAAAVPPIPTPGTPQPLSVTRFHVRIAHASYSKSTPSKALWATFTDGWFVAINNDKACDHRTAKRDALGSGARPVH